MPPPSVPAALAALEPERRYLWAICYRMLGSAADADDAVQEAFVRALERPPPDTSAAWRPWLVRVAMNLCRDHLRRRKRTPYHGCWLPSPVDAATDDDATAPSTDPESSPEARYGLKESASFAFLVALEALSPSQRAVLLLRDVFDLSSAEAAATLAMSEENVRVTLHRARRVMAAYDRSVRPTGAATGAAMAAALGGLVRGIASRDATFARALFAPDAELVADGGGLVHASPRPVRGGEKIAHLYSKLATRASAGARVELRTVNGQPALVVQDPAPKPPNARRSVMFVEVDAQGRIRRLFSVLSPRKLTHVSFAGIADASPAG